MIVRERFDYRLQYKNKFLSFEAKRTHGIRLKKSKKSVFLFHNLLRISLLYLLPYQFQPMIQRSLRHYLRSETSLCPLIVFVHLLIFGKQVNAHFGSRQMASQMKHIAYSPHAKYRSNHYRVRNTEDIV